MGRAARAAEGQQSEIPQGEFEQRVRNYLLAHPEVVGEALSRLEAKQGELQAAAVDQAERPLRSPDNRTEKSQWRNKLWVGWML
jgi:hypothetical protein